MRVHREAKTEFERYVTVGSSHVSRHLLAIMSLLTPLRRICSGGTLREQAWHKALPCSACQDVDSGQVMNGMLMQEDSGPSRCRSLACQIMLSRPSAIQQALAFFSLPCSNLTPNGLHLRVSHGSRDFCAFAAASEQSTVDDFASL